MRVTQIQDMEFPDEIVVNVYGWRWPDDAVGDRGSKAVFDMLFKRTSVKKPDSGIGVYRSRVFDPVLQDATGPWFVWIVDVNFGLFDRLPELRKLAVERVEPDEATAQKLVMRHVRTTAEEWEAQGQGLPAQTGQKAHYGMGALFDELGFVHLRVGKG